MDVFEQKLNNDQVNTLDELWRNQTIIGYADLCRKLNIEPSRGNKKAAQLSDIREYCDLKEVRIGNSKKVKYIVAEIYPKAIIELNGLLKTSKMQLFFESIIYNKLLEKSHRNYTGDPKSDYLYVSHTQLLEICGEINSNFHYLLNHDYIKENYADKLYMAEMAPIIQRIFVQWTRRRLDAMCSRGIVDIEKGYRLYRESYFTDTKGKKFAYYVTEDVVDENLEKKVRAINAKAILNTVPEKFFTKNDNDITLSYLPSEIYRAYKKMLHELLHEAFPEENYTDLKRILVIKPPTNDYLFKLLEKNYGELVRLGLDVINNEACRKILNTSQLNEYKNEQRTEFIETSIKPGPKVSFKLNYSNY